MRNVTFLLPLFFLPSEPEMGGAGCLPSAGCQAGGTSRVEVGGWGWRRGRGKTMGEGLGGGVEVDEAGQPSLALELGRF